MGRSLTVGVSQFAPALGQVQANARRMVEIVHSLRAAHDALDLVVFPELALTGYDAGNAFWQLSADVPEALSTLQVAAKEATVGIAAGLPQRDPHRPGVLYDALALIGPDGKLSEGYRKVHLWQQERLYFGAGDIFRLAPIASVAVGLGICWDIGFPEWGRALAQAGAEVLLVASAWDEGSIGYWDALLRARAIENGCFVVACNRAGSDGALPFGGHSQVLAPTGDALGFLEGTGEGALVVELDLDAVGARRFSDLTSLRDLRPDVYQKPPQR